MEAIGILEELLKIKKVHFGTTSREFSRSCKQLCEICNILAVYYLKKEDVNSALLWRHAIVLRYVLLLDEKVLPVTHLLANALNVLG